LCAAAVDFFADRALQRDYERTGFEQLLAIARIAQSNPPQLTSLSPERPKKFPRCKRGCSTLLPAAPA